MRDRNKKGHALVEMVFVSLLSGILLSGFLRVNRITLLRQRALAAARFAATLKASGLLTDETVSSELADHMAHMHDGALVEWNWTLGKFDETPASHFYNLAYANVTALYHIKFAGELSLPPLLFSEKIVLQEADVP